MRDGSCPASFFWPLTSQSHGVDTSGTHNSGNVTQTTSSNSFSCMSITPCLCDFPFWVKLNAPNCWFFYRSPIVNRGGHSVCWWVFRSCGHCVNRKHYKAVSSPVAVHFAARSTTVVRKRSFSLTSPLGCWIFLCRCSHFWAAGPPTK